MPKQLTEVPKQLIEVPKQLIEEFDRGDTRTRVDELKSLTADTGIYEITYVTDDLLLDDMISIIPIGTT